MDSFLRADVPSAMDHILPPVFSSSFFSPSPIRESALSSLPSLHQSLSRPRHLSNLVNASIAKHGNQDRRDQHAIPAKSLSSSDVVRNAVQDWLSWKNGKNPEAFDLWDQPLRIKVPFQKISSLQSTLDELTTGDSKSVLLSQLTL